MWRGISFRRTAIDADQVVPRPQMFYAIRRKQAAWFG